MKRIPRLYPYRSIPILLYHRVAEANPKKGSPRLSVSPDAFDRQMRYLHEHGFASISLDKYLDLIKNASRPEKKYIVITFNDGFLDNYTDAFPTLVKYGFKATIFLVADYMGKTKTWGLQKGMRLMSWQQAREMAHHAISFQSHTCTHPDLTGSTDDKAMAELVDSKRRIEDQLGLPVNHFAYPYGRWNARLIASLREANYQSAYASGIAENGKFSIERFECHEGFPDFRIKTSVFGYWLRNIYNYRKSITNTEKKIYAPEK